MADVDRPAEQEHYTDFMCACNDESRAEAEACLARVLEKLEATPADLLTKVVYHLQWGMPDRYIGAIDGIGCDMWCGVSAKVRRDDPGETRYVDHATIFVQCDLVEHGVARAFELAMESAQ